MKNYEDAVLKRKLREFKDLRDFLFEKGYIKSNKIVAELGEHFSSKILNLDLNKKSNEKGYDAKDSSGKKVEIKTRQEHSRNLSPYIYSGFKGNLSFDYVLIVLLDENCWIKEIWKMLKEDIKKYRTKTGTINFLNTRKDKIAAKIYP